MNLFLLTEVSSLKLYYLLRKKNGKRSCSAHQINMSRRRLGEFHHLYEQLRQHPAKFHSYFRMNISTFDYILDKIQQRLLKKWTNFNINPISPAERLVVTLRYLATGTSFKSLGFTFRMGATTVSSIVEETVKAIWEILQPIHMKVPTETTFKEIAKEFYDKWNFPNCLGAIDGKHMRVKCPSHSGTMFYNYKHFFSIVLQAVADANYKFITIDVGGYGKQSDGGTLRSSSFFRLMESGGLQIPPDSVLPSTNIVVPYVFIGDEAYPLLKNLLKPYNRRHLDANKEYFNMRLSRARRVVECSFGIISAKFRILHKPIETSPNFADNIIKCICILHNIIIDMEGLSMQTENIEPPNLEDDIGERRNNRYADTANFVRETFKMFVCQNRIQIN